MMKTPTPTRFGTGPRRVGLSAALALFALSVLPTGAETMTFTATGDNTMLSGNLANDNYGAYNPISSGTVSAYNQHSILRFNISALDGLYTSIDSITLRLYYYNDTVVPNSNALLDTFLPVDTTSAAASNWTTLGPFDLSAADNTHIYLEFRYDGTDGNFIGLYLDDVVVSPN